MCSAKPFPINFAVTAAEAMEHAKVTWLVPVTKDSRKTSMAAHSALWYSFSLLHFSRQALLSSSFSRLAMILNANAAIPRQYSIIKVTASVQMAIAQRCQPLHLLATALLAFQIAWAALPSQPVRCVKTVIPSPTAHVSNANTAAWVVTCLIYQFVWLVQLDIYSTTINV